MHLSSPTFCFATLCYGATYRAIVRELLSKDIEKYAPNIPLLILTDKPSDFKDCTNVILVKHEPLFHLDNDKTFVIKTALEKFDFCICIDGDMRLIGPLPQNLEFKPGITARSCSQLLQHVQEQVERTETPRPAPVRNLQVLRQIAQKLDVNVEDKQATFVHEFLFVVRRDGGKEAQLLELAEKISRYQELHGSYVGYGTALGMAATKVGVPVYHSEMPGVQFFDDRIEKVRISKGQAEPAASTIYFEQLQKIENPPRSLPQKLIAKTQKAIRKWRRTNRLKQDAAKNPSFYYQ